jgi:hypothetical protein
LPARNGGVARRAHARGAGCGERRGERLAGEELGDGGRSTALRPVAIVTIDPLSMADSSASGSIARNCSRVGARPTPASWHWAHVHL